jgi:hypothetical protein
LQKLFLKRKGFFCAFKVGREVYLDDTKRISGTLALGTLRNLFLKGKSFFLYLFTGGDFIPKAPNFLVYFYEHTNSTIS